MDKAQAARTQIVEEVADASAEVMQLDLASLKSIHQFVDKFKAKYDRLDVLLNNGGVMFLPERAETEDGFELTLGTNCLGHFALTGLLLDVLKETPCSRVVNVTSFAHRSGEMDFDDLMFENNGFHGGDAYAASKLANILFTYELQRRFESTGIDCISVAVDPGFVRANWLRHQRTGNRFNRFMASILGIGLRIIGQSVEMGGLSLLRVAVDPEVKGGEYFNPDGRFGGYPVRAESSEASYSEEDARRLWAVSEELTGVRYPLPVPVMP
jgi:NAD(P)-dependent dehydrogenase (short-subunit alcohol dehydrogenase family)